MYARMHSRRIHKLAARLAAMLTIGCAPPPTVGPGFAPNAREQRLWATTREMSAELQASGKLYADPRLQEYVQSVLDRLVRTDPNGFRPLQPHVFILDAPSINAFTFPHGDIYVHTGILGRMRSEAQLAMLLGHELTHATHRHTAQEQQDVFAKTGINAYVGVLSSLAGHYGNAISGLGSFMTIAAITGYSREKEAEADHAGLTLLFRAGYEPREAAGMFRQMLAAADRKQRGFSFFYSTHPRMQDRVDTCERVVRVLSRTTPPRELEVGRDPYVHATRALILGEVQRHTAQGKYALAEQTVTFLIALDESDAEAHVEAGDLYRARRSPDDLQRAESAYARACELDPSQGRAYRGLGLLHAASGNRAAACDNLRKYLSLAPNAADAAYIRQYVEQLEGGS